MTWLHHSHIGQASGALPRPALVVLLIFLGSSAGAPGPLAAPAPTVAAVENYLAEEARAQRQRGRLDAGRLADRLKTRFPAASPDLLLRAAILTDTLDSVDMPCPEPPAPVHAPGQVYSIDLFNRLLGQSREQPAAYRERPGEAVGKTALMYAAELNRFEVLRTLLPMRPDGAFEPLYGKDAAGRPYIDWCDRYGYTALMHAGAAGSTDAVNYLLNAGADLATECRVAKLTALQLAQIGAAEAARRASADPRAAAQLSRYEMVIGALEAKRRDQEQSQAAAQAQQEQLAQARAELRVRGEEHALAGWMALWTTLGSTAGWSLVCWFGWLLFRKKQEETGLLHSVLGHALRAEYRRHGVERTELEVGLEAVNLLKRPEGKRLLQQFRTKDGLRRDLLETTIRRWVQDHLPRRREEAPAAPPAPAS